MIINAFEGFFSKYYHRTQNLFFFLNWTIKNLNLHELIHLKQTITNADYCKWEDLFLNL